MEADDGLCRVFLGVINLLCLFV